MSASIFVLTMILFRTLVNEIEYLSDEVELNFRAVWDAVEFLKIAECIVDRSIDFTSPRPFCLLFLAMKKSWSKDLVLFVCSSIFRYFFQQLKKYPKKPLRWINFLTQFFFFPQIWKTRPAASDTSKSFRSSENGSREKHSRRCSN